MLTYYGPQFLRWLRREVIPAADEYVHRFDDYLARWEALLLNLPYKHWPPSTPEIR